MAPIIKFLAILGEIPLPLSINGTNCRLILSAVSNCLIKCWSCFRSSYTVFPKYLYELTFLNFLFLYHKSHGNFVIYSVLSMFSSILNLSNMSFSTHKFFYNFIPLSIMAISSAKANIPTYSLSRNSPLF